MSGLGLARPVLLPMIMISAWPPGTVIVPSASLPWMRTSYRYRGLKMTPLTWTLLAFPITPAASRATCGPVLFCRPLTVIPAPPQPPAAKLTSAPMAATVVTTPARRMMFIEIIPFTKANMRRAHSVDAALGGRFTSPPAGVLSPGRAEQDCPAAAQRRHRAPHQAPCPGTSGPPAGMRRGRQRGLQPRRPARGTPARSACRAATPSKPTGAVAWWQSPQHGCRTAHRPPGQLGGPAAGQPTPRGLRTPLKFDPVNPASCRGAQPASSDAATAGVGLERWGLSRQTAVAESGDKLADRTAARPDCKAGGALRRIGDITPRDGEHHGQR